jgi:hypothetical protein
VDCIRTSPAHSFSLYLVQLWLAALGGGLWVESRGEGRLVGDASGLEVHVGVEVMRRCCESY